MWVRISLMTVLASVVFLQGSKSTAHADDAVRARVTAALPTLDVVATAANGNVAYLEVAGCPAFLIRPQGKQQSAPLPWVWYAPAIRGSQGRLMSGCFVSFWLKALPWPASMLVNRWVILTVALYSAHFTDCLRKIMDVQSGRL